MITKPPPSWLDFIRSEGYGEEKKINGLTQSWTLYAATLICQVRPADVTQAQSFIGMAVGNIIIFFFLSRVKACPTKENSCLVLS